MSTIMIKNAQAIITLDNEDRVLKNQNILIENEKIKYIGKETFDAEEIINGSSSFVYPGLINTHHHLYQTFTRNLPQVQNMELFDWLVTLYEIWRKLNNDIIYYSSLVGMGELLKYGCTTCFDHHYVFPKKKSDQFIDMQFDAAEKLGIRFHASRGSMSRGKSDGGLPPDDLVQGVAEILDDCNRLIEKYHNPDNFSMQQVVIAPCSPFSVTSDLMKDAAKLAREKGVRLHTHLAETMDENNYCLDNFNMRPLDYMESLGWLGEDVWFAHGIHFSDEEIRKLAETQTGVAHCPVSNQKLASGVAKVPLMLEMGVPLGLAVDGSASNDCSNLLAEIRASYLIHRLHYSSKAPSGYDILKIATKGSANVLGRKDIGSLEVGKAADMFVINTNRLELAGAHLDPKSMLGTVGFNRPVDFTIVNGKIVVKNGELCNIDENEVVLKSNSLVERMIL
ncbi:MAG: hydroxydechloroatrazine ethylaminohydrolase [Desulfitibacter sp. BRH_c19]|nr:MAG: hydroxydechloroatrazine ethylaminohydrolase [Desulfitibacter sp. BRH_c19]